MYFQDRVEDFTVPVSSPRYLRHRVTTDFVGNPVIGVIDRLVVISGERKGGPVCTVKITADLKICVCDSYVANVIARNCKCIVKP